MKRAERGGWREGGEKTGVDANVVLIISKFNTATTQKNTYQ